MQIDLSQVPAERSRLFLDHLRVRLPYLGSLSIETDGSSGITEEICMVNLDLGGDEPSQVRFVVRWTQDGTLVSLEARAETSHAWRDAIRGFVQQALIDTLAERSQKILCNEVFAYLGSPLVGEYRLGSRRLVRLTPDEPRLRIPVEHAVLLSFAVDAPDEPRANSLGWLRSNDFMAVLGCLLGIGFYRFRYERLWSRMDDGQYHRLPHTFNAETIPKSMPAKAKPDELGAFTVREAEPIEAPNYMIGRESIAVWSDTRSLLRAFESLGLTERERFLGAARLFQIALTAGHNLTTVRIAYQISALDSLLAKSSARALVDFVGSLVPNADRRMVQEAYEKIRSAHYHSGRLVAEDQRSTRIFMAPFISEPEPQSWRGLEQTLWSALTNWLRENGSEGPAQT